MKVKSESEVARSCPTLSDPMDCSLLGSSIHGIFQARVLKWGAIAFLFNSFPLIWKDLGGHGDKYVFQYFIFSWKYLVIFFSSPILSLVFVYCFLVIVHLSASVIYFRVINDTIINISLKSLIV